MIRLLADDNADSHLEILVRVLLSESWISLWSELGAAVVAFEDLGLDRDSSDAELWRTCQREQIVLVTNNTVNPGTKLTARAKCCTLNVRMCVTRCMDCGYAAGFSEA